MLGLARVAVVLAGAMVLAVMRSWALAAVVFMTGMVLLVRALPPHFAARRVTADYSASFSSAQRTSLLLLLFLCAAAVLLVQNRSVLTVAVTASILLAFVVRILWLTKREGWSKRKG